MVNTAKLFTMLITPFYIPIGAYESPTCFTSSLTVAGQSFQISHSNREHVYVHALSHVQLFVNPWTIARQAPLSMWFFQARILEWVAISSSRDLSDPGIEPVSPALAGGFFSAELPGKPPCTHLTCHVIVLSIFTCIIHLILIITLGTYFFFYFVDISYY